MTQEQRSAEYRYQCSQYGRVDCDFEHVSEDPEDFRTTIRDHYQHVHRPEDYDPEAIEALIVMQTVEP